MMDEYYQLRGGDPKTGYLKKDTLQKLGLKDTIGPIDGKVI